MHCLEWGRVKPCSQVTALLDTGLTSKKSVQQHYYQINALTITLHMLFCTKKLPTRNPSPPKCQCDQSYLIRSAFVPDMLLFSVQGFFPLLEVTSICLGMVKQQVCCFHLLYVRIRPSAITSATVFKHKFLSFPSDVCL